MGKSIDKKQNSPTAAKNCGHAALCRESKGFSKY
jgi:hypothetical protein